MKSLGWLLLAILAAYGCALVAPLCRLLIRGRLGVFLGWCFVPTLLLCPGIIPSANTGLRALASFVSGDIIFRLVEFFRHLRPGQPSMSLRDYYGFLSPFPVLSALFPEQKRRLAGSESVWPEVWRVLGGSLGFCLALLAITLTSRVAWLRSSFTRNHVVMLLIFVVAIESLARALCGLERLAGFDTTPFVRNAYLSQTVSEFWQRYNNRIHDWLYRNVFVPSGGRRAPVGSVLLVFLVSGLFHEAGFAVATSRLTGYQLAFFTIQGPAALASGRLERLARQGGIAGKVVAHGSTILFLAVTSVLFFDGVAKVFPFVYVSKSPLP